MENVKKISLITTLYNEANNILIFLESYKFQTKYADEFIIVDGGSIDNTVSIIEEFASENEKLNIKVIIDKTCNKKHITGPIAKGRNVAIENTKYSYIAVTDAGCVLDKKWFEEITKPFNDSGVDVVAGWYEANIQNSFQSAYVEITMKKLHAIDPEIFLPSSRSLAMKKECWLKAGKYPELTYTAEDTMFDIGMKKHGCQFSFIPTAVVYWDCPHDIIEAKKKHYNYAYGDGQHRIELTKNILRLILLPILLVYYRFTIPNTEYYTIRKYLVFSHVRGYFKGLLTIKKGTS